MEWVGNSGCNVVNDCRRESQMAGAEKGKRHPDTQKTEDRAKKKVDENAYQDALKSVPASNEKPDPWKSMR